MRSPRRQQGAAAGAVCRLPAAVLALAAALAAPGALAAEHEVSIVDYKFEPAVVEIRPGDTVTWVNNEKRTSHSVVFDATGEESERFFPGERWSHTFGQAGEFSYHCGPHPEMTGKVVVAD
ncbi:cupredoxin domain-containing protein [Thauera sp. CAU 1555]|uniref:Cupredoxin domain-containing protein n=1 Tax=Thauera sedimentorum TaxID=2767595 RepID=A0ABR9B6R1_9RHOO|nr:plastocyanin/azurin family copper-binding protein [Thauera sedimentorum]MBC9070962.1 cupredoxin domain-containing protein [Thauera sedimentorum]MBD8501881.1 cupredoxin domain-containing protein [Thauera sedimentorum]